MPDGTRTDDYKDGAFGGLLILLTILAVLILILAGQND